MRRHAPFYPTDLNICMWSGVADVINCTKFFENPSMGLGAVRPRKIAFPIEIVHRPYNSDGTTVGSRTIRTLDYSYLGVFVPWTVRTLLDCSYHGLFVPSLDFSYPGLFVPWIVRTFLDCSYRGLFVPSLLRKAT